ncbi:MAG: hypothetical protein HZA51_16470 [Planctomycetes bacterium]|nr:hypothetical protein [Planctomycetota bacterium]
MKEPRRTLVLAPYVGEFGWELMNWQARVRWLVAQGGHSRVVVVATADRKPLYDFSFAANQSQFIACENPDMPGHANDDHRIDDSGKPFPAEQLTSRLHSFLKQACRAAIDDWDSTDILTPPFDSTIWPTTSRHQHFADLREPAPIESDIVLIPRSRSIADQRNQPAQWWGDLAARLRSHGLRVETYAHGVADAIRQLSRTRLAIGASTGGLHLASLCRCPHYVWGCGSEARWTRLGMTNRQRYETVWNPLGTPCIYDECGWQPTVDHVANRAFDALAAIGLRADRHQSKPRQGAAWRLRRGLSRFMQPDFAPAMPWRLRRLIVDRLV